jgi:hypothetical protein
MIPGFMSTQVTVMLPDDVLRRAESLAALSGRAVADVLAETIELSLRPLGEAAKGQESPEHWSDEQVMAAVNLQMPPDEDRRLSELLARQQEGVIDDTEKPELWSLIEACQTGLLEKARALREAVRRGLRGPLEP